MTQGWKMNVCKPKIYWFYMELKLNNIRAFGFWQLGIDKKMPFETNVALWSFKWVGLGWDGMGWKSPGGAMLRASMLLIIADTMKWWTWMALKGGQGLWGFLDTTTHKSHIMRQYYHSISIPFNLKTKTHSHLLIRVGSIHKSHTMRQHSPALFTMLPSSFSILL